ncbi:hypothetical protein [Pseudidiomarina sp.]|uniref:hypothetical protein n=1 Tax=Pseudidiomarina sp. TaxID=2081707 RepID=UPI003A96C802
MSQRLQITLSEEATARYLELASAKTEAEVDADVEPSGASIQVDIWHLMNEVMMEQGSGNWVSIGEADVEVLE